MTGYMWRRAVVESAVPLRLRTRLGRATAAQHLESLERALTFKGWRCLRLYALGAVPLMWVYVGSGVREVGTLVTVRATPGGWCYYRSPDGQLLAPCGDAGTAAGRLDGLLKPELFPGTFGQP